MSKATDLETLKDIFADSRRWVAIGVVQSLDLAKDNSALRVKVKLLPEERVAVVDMAWAHCGAGSGLVSFPEPLDFVMVCFAEGDYEHGFVVARLSSSQDKLPIRAKDGHLVLQANPGKHSDLGSDTQANVIAPKVNIGKTATSPTEPLVLGNVLVSCLTAILNDFLNAPQIGQGPTGPVMLDPTVRTNLQSRISTYLNTASTNILSQLAFTERGN